MGSPAIFNGSRTKLLTSSGLLLSAGNTIDYDGQINYVLNPGFEINSTGYNVYANTAQTTPVNGTGGSPTVTIARSTTTPLFQTASGLFTHGASNQQGQGFSYDFTIDAGIETAATPCTISGYYNVASGTYDSGIIVWIYDKTNAVLIPVSAATINNNIGASPFQCEFQPNTNSTSYRLIFHCSTTTANAYTLQFDNIAVRPNTYNPGAAVTAWTAYTPVFSAGFGTTTITNFIYRRAGSCLEVTGTFASGTVAASIATMTLPSGLSIDSTVLTQGNTSSGAGPQVGYWIGNSNGNEGAVLAATGTNAALFYFSAIGSSNQLIPQNGTGTFSSGQTIAFYASVPIAGWGVTQNLSSDTDTRVITTIISNSSTLALSTGTMIFNMINSTTNGSYNTSTGVYTVGSPGYYDITLSNATLTGAGQQAIGIQQNGGIANYILTFNGAGLVGGGATQLKCVAGDTLNFTASGSGPSMAAGALISISRRQGPAQIAASESINMCASKNAGSQTSSGSYQVIPSWDLVSRDSHNAFNSTTGVYTCPAPGFYSVCGTVQFGNNTTGIRSISVQKNGSNFVIGDLDLPGGLTNGTISVSVNSGVPCLAGDTLSIAAFQSSGGTLAYNTNTAGTNITIFRAGN